MNLHTINVFVGQCPAVVEYQDDKGSARIVTVLVTHATHGACSVQDHLHPDVLAVYARMAQRSLDAKKAVTA